MRGRKKKSDYCCWISPSPSLLPLLLLFLPPPPHVCLFKPSGGQRGSPPRPVGLLAILCVFQCGGIRTKAWRGSGLISLRRSQPGRLSAGTHQFPDLNDIKGHKNEATVCLIWYLRLRKNGWGEGGGVILQSFHLPERHDLQNFCLDKCSSSFWSTPSMGSLIHFSIQTSFMKQSYWMFNDHYERMKSS